MRKKSLCYFVFETFDQTKEYKQKKKKSEAVPPKKTHLSFFAYIIFAYIIDIL